MKPEDITDEQLKTRMIESTFHAQKVMDVFASMSNSAFIDFSHRVAKEKVDKMWETITGAKIDELKAQMAAEERNNDEG